MDSFLLKTFVTLCEVKSFTAAAGKLLRSQSAISLQINRLENLVGKQLLCRNKRHVRLTPDGEQMLGYARRMLRLELEMIESFRKTPVTGTVSLGTPEDIATSYLPKILARFAKAYPDVSLEVNCEFTKKLIHGYETGQYDLVIVKQDPSFPHPSSKSMWQEPLVWVGREAVNLQVPIPLVLAPTPCVYRKRVLDALDHAGLMWRITYTSPSLAGTIAAVKAGLGISALPLHQIPKAVQRIDNLPLLKSAQIALLRPENAKVAVAELAAFITEQIQQRT